MTLLGDYIDTGILFKSIAVGLAMQSFGSMTQLDVYVVEILKMISSLNAEQPGFSFSKV